MNLYNRKKENSSIPLLKLAWLFANFLLTQESGFYPSGANPDFWLSYAFSKEIFVVYLNHKPSHNRKVKLDGGIFLKRKKEGYFTIGEISKVTGIHPKSIRYYERIGAIKPAMVVPETSYRYYKSSQFKHFSVIKACIQMGIPLRDFKNFYKDGMLHADSCLQNAAEFTRKNMELLQNNLTLIQKAQAYIKQTDLLITAGTVLETEYDEQHFFVQEIPPDISLYALFQCYRQLYTEALRQDLQPESFWGKIAVFRQGTCHRLYAGIQITRCSQDPRILTLPGGSYAALYTPASEIHQAHLHFPDRAGAGQELLVLESDAIASKDDVEASGYILRCISR